MCRLLLKGNNKLSIGPLYSIIKTTKSLIEYLIINPNNPFKSSWTRDYTYATIIRKDKNKALEYAKFYHAEIKEW
jgi:hypothetical protein